MKRIVLIAAAALTSCAPQYDPKIAAVIAQKNLDNLSIGCRDGVEYFVNGWDSPQGMSVSPRLHADGKPFVCRKGEL